MVEVFGDYWHGRMKTGKAGFEHEQELVHAFADIGFDCLVIWESQVKNDPAEVRDRIRAFLGAQKNIPARSRCGRRRTP